MITINTFDSVYHDLNNGKPYVLIVFPDQNQFLAKLTTSNEIQLTCVLCGDRACPMIVHDAITSHDRMIEHINMYHLQKFREWQQTKSEI